MPLGEIARAGSEQYEQGRRLAVAVARRYGISALDAEDIYQDAILRVLRYVTDGGEPDNLDAFITTVVRNLCIDRVRRAGREDPVEEPGDFTAPIDPKLDAAQANSELVRQTLSQLNERSRHVLVKAHVEGYKPAEIAQHLGLSPNTASAMLYRARKTFRRYYVRAHLTPAVDPECSRVRLAMAAVEAGEKVDAQALVDIDEHKPRCPECAEQHAILLAAGSTANGLTIPGTVAMAGALPATGDTDRSSPHDAAGDTAARGLSAAGKVAAGGAAAVATSASSRTGRAAAKVSSKSMSLITAGVVTTASAAALALGAVTGVFNTPPAPEGVPPALTRSPDRGDDEPQGDVTAPEPAEGPQEGPEAAPPDSAGGEPDALPDVANPGPSGGAMGMVAPAATEPRSDAARGSPREAGSAPVPDEGVAVQPPPDRETPPASEDADDPTGPGEQPAPEAPGDEPAPEDPGEGEPGDTAPPPGPGEPGEDDPGEGGDGEPEAPQHKPEEPEPGVPEPPQPPAATLSTPERVVLKPPITRTFFLVTAGDEGLSGASVTVTAHWAVRLIGQSDGCEIQGGLVDSRLMCRLPDLSPGEQTPVVMLLVALVTLPEETTMTAVVTGSDGEEIASAQWAILTR